MKNHRLLLIITGIVALLFIASLTYSMLSDQDLYNYHTGLGSSISVSPDDMTLVFSYYENGSEAIYQGSVQGGAVEKVTDPANEDHRRPQLSPDGEGLVYLAADNDGVQSLQFKSNVSADRSERLTGTDAHVVDAAFSPDGRTIYYIAMPSEDFLKPEGGKENGADLFSVPTEGGEPVKLTDKDSFAMDGLTASADGNTLYYTEFDGVQGLMAYSIAEGTETAALQGALRGDVYQLVFSPVQELLAYTAVSESSFDSGSTYEYELFLLKTATSETNKLTDFRAFVTSPSFFHQDNRIAFLSQPNWPDQPEDFELMTVNYDSGEIASVRLDLPETTRGFQPAILAYWVTTPVAITGLYLLLFGLLTVYSRRVWNKAYVPAIISAILSGIAVAGSFAAASFDPWIGIGVFMLAAGMAACTAVIFVFALLYSNLAKRKRRNNRKGALKSRFLFDRNG
ncbi:hypothetical protein [Planococcus dechangensis]|uniref:PD40 domain-containing protein n=1 Tax=Planococcus dechangensis TaxID=1176255 RepID=A0ABV9MBU0_9BACL